MNLRDLFNKCIEYGKFIRNNTINPGDIPINGLVEWQEVKKLLDKDNEICGGWKINRIIENNSRQLSTSDIGKIYDYVHNNLEIKGENGDTDDDANENHDWKKFHFFLQTIRIPKESPKCTLLKICQIGYNLGQLFIHYDEYTTDAQNYYTTNSLNLIESYIDLNQCDEDADYTEIITKIDKLIEQINNPHKIFKI